MEEDGKKYCVICSCVVVTARENGGDGGDDDGGKVVKEEEDLTKILKLLLKSPLNCYQRSRRSEEEVEDLEEGHGLLEETFKNLEETNSFSLCSECGGVTSGALESRSRAERMEAEVRELQGKILELLRGLQKEMEVFHEEMSKIEDIIVIKSGGVEVGEGVKGREDAVLVREEILEVVTELRFYQADLQDKLILNRVEGQTMLEVSTDEVEVDFVPDMKLETEEDEEVDPCDIDDLINFEGCLHEMSSSVTPEEDEEETSPSFENDVTHDDPPNRYVGHVVGLASEERENSERKNLRRRFPWREEHPFACPLCGEGIPTQNKLTRHLKRVHGQIPGQEKAERLRRPAVRYNNEAVSEEILSKALVCMTKNVEEKDRNTKSLEERKRERKEKVAMLRAQWKSIRKSIKPKTRPPPQVGSKIKTKKAVAAGVSVRKIRRKGGGGSLQQNIRSKKTGVVVKSNGNKVPRGKTEAPVPVVVEVKEEVPPPSSPPKSLEATPPTSVASASSSPVKKKQRVDKVERPPLRRSTRGQCVLNIKDVMIEKERRSSKSGGAGLPQAPAAEETEA